MKTTALLMEEHRHILRALYILEQMAIWTDKGQRIDDQDVEAILDFLKRFADEHHQSKEETILFPAMVAASRPVQNAALNQMIFEHDQERSLVEGLEDSLRTNHGKEFVYFAQRLVHVLRTHIYKEDHILFELADDILSKEEDAQAARDLQNCDSEWRAKVLDGLLAQLHRMEWKYLGRTGAPPGEGKRYA
jgi:hemerythrin-like domain-containing protein